MSVIKFTDVRPHYNGSETYLCPNECLVTLRRMLDEHIPKGVKRGGSIASGGEVALTVVLPRVESLKIVDHNYGSLFWTCTKILMLRHLSNDEILRITTQPYYQGLMMKFVEQMKEHYPPVLWNYEQAKSASVFYQWSTFQAYWERYIPPTALDVARERLDEVELIHGDIRDLGEDLELLYISNALEHQHCTMKMSLRAGIHQILKPGSKLLLSGDFRRSPELVIVKQGGPDGSTIGGWYYYLCQREEVKDAADEKAKA